MREKFYCILGVLLCLNSWASLPESDALQVPDYKFERQNFDEFGKKEAEMMIPYHRLRQGMNQEQVTQELLSHNIRMFSKGQLTPNMRVFRAYRNAKKGVRVDFQSFELEFRGKKNQADNKVTRVKEPKDRSQTTESPRAEKAAFYQEPEAINHKFKVKINPFRQDARLSYKGFVECDLRYDVEEQTSQTRVGTSLWENFQLSYSHQQRDDINEINLRWNW